MSRVLQCHSKRSFPQNSITLYFLGRRMVPLCRGHRGRYPLTVAGISKWRKNWTNKKQFVLFEPSSRTKITEKDIDHSFDRIVLPSSPIVIILYRGMEYRSGGRIRPIRNNSLYSSFFAENSLKKTLTIALIGRI